MKEEKRIFTNYDKKDKLSIECCKLLRKSIPDFQDVINIFARCLLGQQGEKSFDESFLISIFNQKCNSIYNKEIRKEIWNSLIIDHLAFVGAETKENSKSERIKKLLDKLKDIDGNCDKDSYSYEISTGASYCPSTTDIQTDSQGKILVREWKNNDFGSIIQEEQIEISADNEENQKVNTEWIKYWSPERDEYIDEMPKTISGQILTETNHFEKKSAKEEGMIENDINSDFMSEVDIDETYFYDFSGIY